MKWTFLTVTVILGFFTFVGIQASQGNVVAIVFSVFLGILVLLALSHLSHVYMVRTVVRSLESMFAANRKENVSLARVQKEGWNVEESKYRAFRAAQRAGYAPDGTPLLAGEELPGLPAPAAPFYDSEDMFERLDAEDRRHRNGSAGQPVPRNFRFAADDNGEEETDL